MAAARVARRYRGMDARDRLIQSEQMLIDYNNGMQVSALAEKYNYSPATIHNRLSAALKQRVAPQVDEYRQIVDALLSDQMAKLEEHLAAVDRLIALGSETRDVALIERAMVQRLHTIETRTRVADRRAKLMGLDMPVRADVHVTVTTPVDTAVAGLLAEMDAADESTAAVTVTTAGVEASADRS